MAKADVKLTPAALEHLHAFLDTVLNRKTVHLYAIDPAGGSPKGYIGTDLAEMEKWVAQHLKHNLYYAFNHPREAKRGKAKAADIEWLSGFHVDIDLPTGATREEWFPATIQRIRAVVPEGDCPDGRMDIVMSGNGLQAIWRFERPLLATAANVALVEDINRRLAHALGGDNCHNIDRILRLPGTFNHPDDRKLLKGYTVVPTEYVQHGEAVWMPSDFDDLPAIPLPPAPSTNNVKREDPRLITYSDGYEPMSYRELVNDWWPAIGENAKANTDSSEAIYGFIHDCIRAFCLDNNRPAVKLADNTDIRRNIAELVWESGLPFLDHFILNPPGKLAVDIEAAFQDAITQHTGATAQLKAMSAKARVRAERTAKGTLTQAEHREAFAEWAKKQMVKEGLPNCKFTNNGVPVLGQQATERNIKAALAKWSINIHWNVMGEEPFYECLDKVGGPHWDGAMEGTHSDRLPQVAESLLCDCFCELGMVARDDLAAMMQEIGRARRFHPLEDYCTDRPWDGRRSAIADIAACVESTHPLKQKFFRLFFRSCVGAVKSLDHYMATGDGLMLPGVVLLVGEQGIGKSKLWTALTPVGFKSKGSSLRMGSHGETDAKAECLSGLVCPLNEIGRTMRQSDADALKDFLTQSFDRYRPAYAHHPVQKPRMTVFTGTANPDFELTDPTGSRRYLTMNVTAIDFEALAKVDLQQAYAEAWHEVMDLEEPWWLTDAERAIVEHENAEHQAELPAVSIIMDYLERVTPQHKKHWLSLTQIWKVLGEDPARHRSKAMVRQVLAAWGCEYKEQLYREGKRIARKVWNFPVLPDKLQLLNL